MKGITATIVLCVLALFAACVPAHADEAPQYPILSLARLHVGLRGEYEWAANNSPTIQSATGKDFRVGVGAVYNLVPKFSAIGRVTSKLGGSPSFTLGVNYELFNGHDYAVKHAAKAAQ